MPELDGRVAFLTGAGPGHRSGRRNSAGQGLRPCPIVRTNARDAGGETEQTGRAGERTRPGSSATSRMVATCAGPSPRWKRSRGRSARWSTTPNSRCAASPRTSARRCWRKRSSPAFTARSTRCRPACPAMRQNGGRTVNFGSGASTEGMPELGAYNIAKEAIRGLTKSAAVEWGKYGSPQTPSARCVLELVVRSIAPRPDRADFPRPNGRPGALHRINGPISRWRGRRLHHEPHVPRRWRAVLLRSVALPHSRRTAADGLVEHKCWTPGQRVATFALKPLP